jgi:hypothetical protein
LSPFGSSLKIALFRVSLSLFLLSFSLSMPYS